MGIYLYAELQDPNGVGHAYALHSEVVDARIAELQAQDDQLSYEDATDMAQGEALALARIQESWPDSWSEGGDYMQSFLTPPLAVDYGFERRWEDFMPSLPGNAGGGEEAPGGGGGDESAPEESTPVFDETAAASGPADTSVTADSASIEVTPGTPEVAEESAADGDTPGY